MMMLPVVFAIRVILFAAEGIAVITATTLDMIRQIQQANPKVRLMYVFIRCSAYSVMLVCW